MSDAAGQLTFQQTYIAASLAEYSPGENLVIGPNSAELQLALLAAGTAGQSFREIVRALGVQAETVEAFIESNYLAELLHRRECLNRNGNKEGTWVRSRSCFVTNGRIMSSFEQNLDRFDAAFITASCADGMTEKVNAWAARATATPSTPKGLINPLLNRPLDPLAVFVALTADAFELTFTSPFDPEDTHEASFSSGDGKRQPCDLMFKAFSWCDGAVYFETIDGTCGAVLPYGQDGDFSLRLTKISTKVARGGKPMTQWFGTHKSSAIKTKASEFELRVPRADIAGDRDTAPTRGRLGIYAMYGIEADLTGMLSEAIPGNPYIGESREVSSLKMNEIKTEGAVVQMDVAVAMAMCPPIPQLVLDSTYLVEVVTGNGLPLAGQHEDILMFAVVNKPGRLPPPAADS